jgi:hypothetical protein
MPTLDSLRLDILAGALSALTEEINLVMERGSVIGETLLRHLTSQRFSSRGRSQPVARRGGCDRRDADEKGADRDGRQDPACGAALAQKECALISQRTKAALKAAKARGVQLGNPAQSAANKAAAAERAEVLRAIFVETAALSTRKAAEVLNARGVATPTGKPWGPMTVARVRTRLGLLRFDPGS